MHSIVASVCPAALVRSQASQSAAVVVGNSSSIRSKPAKAPHQVTRHVTAVWSRLTAWKMRRATRTILASLDDRILKDIGLQRSEVDVVLRDVRARAQRWPV